MRGSLLIFCVVLTGCAAVGPNYKRPAVPVPARIRGAENTPQSSSLADLPWWDVFSDPALKALVQKSITNNYDLRIAVRRIDQARGNGGAGACGISPSGRISECDQCGTK